MILEVAGVSTRNKGAELMLRAVKEHFAQHAGIELAVESRFGTYAERAGYGLRTKIGGMKPGRSALAAALMPTSFRKSCGLAAEADIAAVVDASGFAFSDQLGPERTERFAQDVTRWKRQGKKVVLLPQAFGPFETERVRRAFAEVVAHADLIYARERQSLAYLGGLPGAGEKVRMCPDFTNLVEAETPLGFEPRPRQACVVPNHRMVEKATVLERERYIPFLGDCVRALRALHLSPVVLLHDVCLDEKLVEPLLKEIQGEVPVVRERDPAKLKGILGTAHVVVGSRFHALAGALSQGVPTVAVGWSHKYEMLLEDYGCEGCLLSPLASPREIGEVLGRIVAEPERSELASRIRERSARLKDEVRGMWRDVDKVLNL